MRTTHSQKSTLLLVIQKNIFFPRALFLEQHGLHQSSRHLRTEQAALRSAATETGWKNSKEENDSSSETSRRSTTSHSPSERERIAGNLARDPGRTTSFLIKSEHHAPIKVFFFYSHPEIHEKNPNPRL